MPRVTLKPDAMPMHGKPKKNADYYFKTLYNQQFVHILLNPRTEQEFSKYEKNYHMLFGDLNKYAKALLDDPNEAPAIIERYKRQRKYSSPHRFLLANLMKQYKSALKLAKKNAKSAHSQSETR